MKLTEKQLKQLIRETIQEIAPARALAKYADRGVKAIGKAVQGQGRVDPELVTLAQTLASKAGSVRKAIMILKSLA